MFEYLLATGELDQFINEEPSGAPQLPANVEHVGERNGKPHYRAKGVAVAVESEAVAEKPATVYQLVDLNDLRVGHSCPRCRDGVYKFHNGRIEKCFWCDGKGVISAKDMAYIRPRLANGRINLVKTA